MVVNNSYEENVKDFNMMLNDLDHDYYKWDMHTMTLLLSVLKLSTQ